MDPFQKASASQTQDINMHIYALNPSIMKMYAKPCYDFQETHLILGIKPRNGLQSSHVHAI